MTPSTSTTRNSAQPIRLVGNLPYNISTPLLFHLLEFTDSIVDCHFMLQKEVVDRIAADPGTKDFGRLTVMLACRLRAEWLFDVEPDAFDPPPRVRSAVIRLEPQPAGRFADFDLATLEQLVRQAFSRRRKTMRNALSSLVTADTLAAVGIDPQDRPEQIAVDEWLALARAVAAEETGS